jgi:hypothetical protein
MDKAYFDNRKTQLNSVLKKALGKRCANNFEIQGIALVSERSTAKLFGLIIKPENITLNF